MDKSNDLVQLVSKLEIEGREEDLHKKVHRPWGTYETVSEDKKSKIKRITVYPHSKLSLQLHHKREQNIGMFLKGEAQLQKAKIQ